MSSGSAPQGAASPPPAPAPAVSLSELNKQHKARMAQLRTEAQQSHQRAVTSAATASAVICRDANGPVSEVFKQEQLIEQHIKDLHAQTEQFKQRVGQWSAHFLKLNDALKEIGDVNNWAQSIQRDVTETVDILDRVSEKKRKVTGLQ